MKLLGIILLELLRMVLLGGLLMLQVVVVVISELGKSLELLVVYWEGIRTETGQQACQKRK